MNFQFTIGLKMYTFVLDLFVTRFHDCLLYQLRQFGCGTHTRRQEVWQSDCRHCIWMGTFVTRRHNTQSNKSTMTVYKYAFHKVCLLQHLDLRGWQRMRQKNRAVMQIPRSKDDMF